MHRGPGLLPIVPFVLVSLGSQVVVLVSWTRVDPEVGWETEVETEVVVVIAARGDADLVLDCSAVCCVTPAVGEYCVVSVGVEVFVPGFWHVRLHLFWVFC